MWSLLITTSDLRWWLHNNVNVNANNKVIEHVTPFMKVVKDSNIYNICSEIKTDIFLMSHHKVTFSIYFNPLIYEAKRLQLNYAFIVHTALTLPNLKSLWFKTQKYAKCNVEGVPVNPHCLVPKEDMKWKENTRQMENLFRYAPAKFFIIAKNNCNKKHFLKSY